VRVPCTTRTDVTRTARCYFAPCLVQSCGSYRHGMGTISDCLAPIPEVLFVRHAVYLSRMPCTYHADGRYPHGKVLFYPSPGAKWRVLSAWHGPIFYLPCANRISIIRYARQGFILAFAGCDVKGVIGTARAHFLKASAAVERL